MSLSSSDVLRSYVVGLFMGTADGVPGVSGGTIALIAGVYTRLITAITALTPQRGLQLLDSVVSADGGRLRSLLTEMDVHFLVPLGAGMVTAVVLVTRVVEFANEAYPVVLFGFFFGLIAASVVVLARGISLSTSRQYAAAFAGFSLAFAASGDVVLLQGSGPALVFLSGAVAISAMILPGISGALLLVILGQYVFMSETLTAFTDRLFALLSGGTFDELLAPGTTIAVFFCGALVGLLTIARLVNEALDRDAETTMAFLVSLVVGALRAPITEIGSKGIAWTSSTIETFAVAAIVGAGVLYGLDYYAIDVDIDPSASVD